MTGRPVRPWPVVVIALPAMVAVWTGWVQLGLLCGFGVVQPLPGIVPWHLNTAIVLPIGIEAYGVYAMGAWLTRASVPARARQFAKRSAVGALILGAAAQGAVHLLEAAHATRAPWPVVVTVGTIPVVTTGLAAALWHLMTAPTPATRTRPADTKADTPAGQATGQVATPAAATVAAAPDTPPGHQPDGTAALVAALRTTEPAITQADMAARLGISDRTLRRHLAAAANGHRP